MPVETQKFCIIMRGLPGTGKSYIADKYLRSIGNVFNNEAQAVILSSDDYFIKEKVYHFDKDALADAHKWNFDRFKKEVEKESPLIIIDNTNIKSFHYHHYLDYAQRNNYVTIVVIVPHNNVSNKELSEKNIHNVDTDTIRRMRQSFEWSIKNE